MATHKYIETVGRRKTASARVRITPATKQTLVVNGKSLEGYFPVAEHVHVVLEPLKHSEAKFSITVLVKGGGIAAQAGAVRHGIARALTESESSLRIPLKKAGFLKRDPRAKERRKPGLKKARKAAQWSKR